MPVSFLLAGQIRARSVGRIHAKDKLGRASGFGTGFLISPNLIITNNHVLREPAEARFSEIEFDFELDLDGRVRDSIRFSLDPSKFFQTDRALDFTVVAISPNVDLNREPKEWGWNRLPEGDGLIVKGEYVSIIQHPNGEAKQLALRENRVIDLLDDFAHYHTDTAPGSSGSPVFNDQWELVALHHSGVPVKKNGRIQSVDGTDWEEWMGGHRIKWIANEGVFIERVVQHVKGLSDLSAAQKTLRDELFNSEPPTSFQIVHSYHSQHSGGGRENNPPHSRLLTGSGEPITHSGGATVTIPLNISVSLGATSSPPFSMTSSVVPPAPGLSDGGTDLDQALADHRDSEQLPYYDEDADRADRESYYSSIDPDELSSSEMFAQLSELLKTTHSTKPRYKPSRHVYPWVDLHPDRKIRSIYSGKDFEAEELIREDFRIERERALILQEMMLADSDMSEKQMQEQFDHTRITESFQL